LHGWAKLVSESGSMWTSPTGIDPAEEGQLLSMLELAEERSYRAGGGDARPGDFSKLAEPGHIILFASQAKKLEVGVGDAITVVAETERGATNSADFIVAAVAEDMGMMTQWTAFVTKQALIDI